MQATDRISDTERWMLYAEQDLKTAEVLIVQTETPPRQACWFAQQSAEKALKAILIYLQIDFPRTHDLNTLFKLIPHSWQLNLTHPILASLTEWAVDARYPGEMPEATETDASTAVEQAQTIFSSVSVELARQGFQR